MSIICFMLGGQRKNEERGEDTHTRGTKAATVSVNFHIW